MAEVGEFDGLLERMASYGPTSSMNDFEAAMNYLDVEHLPTAEALDALRTRGAEDLPPMLVSNLRAKGFTIDGD